MRGGAPKSLSYPTPQLPNLSVSLSVVYDIIRDKVFE